MSGRKLLDATTYVCKYAHATQGREKLQKSVSVECDLLWNNAWQLEESLNIETQSLLQTTNKQMN